MCLDINVMNIYNNLIIHTAIKWGTFWQREGRHQSHIWQLLSCLKFRKTCFFKCVIISSVRGSDASASTWHPHHANDNLSGFKGAGPHTSLCVFKYSQTIPSPWPKCWLHTNTPPGWNKKKRDNMKSKHRKKSASLCFQHWYLHKVRRLKGRIMLVFQFHCDMMGKSSNNTKFGQKQFSDHTYLHVWHQKLDR